MSDEETAEKKPWKVVIPDEALANIPEAEREETRKMIMEMFADFDPENPPEGAEPCEVLETAEKDCPYCNTELKAVSLNKRCPGSDEPFDILFCRGCDKSFVTPTRSC